MARRFDEVRVWHEATRMYHAVLDLLEAPDNPFTAAFRHQLDQAALEVPRQIAEGVEVYPRTEQVICLTKARAAVRQVRHMLAIVAERPRVKAVAPRVERILGLADSCGRQLAAFVRAIEENRSGSQGAGAGAGGDGKADRATAGTTDGAPRATRFREGTGPGRAEPPRRR